jgi:peptide/nickel transport system substrate-binding protein
MINRFPLFSVRLSRLGHFLGLFGLCFLIVVGCNRQQGDAPINTPTTSNGHITVGTTLKPRTLDPADNYELAGLIATYNLGDSLYTYELGTTQLKPQLATQMPQISSDGLTYKIPLRQGVLFHDGTPFNAEAMVFSLQRFIKNGGKPSFLLADTVETIKATGQHEITIRLKKPFAAFTAILAFPGACAVSPQAYQIGEGKFNPDRFVGTGPYKLAKLSNDSLRLEVFDRYWGKKPRNQGVDLQIYASNPANLFNAFRTGALSVAYQSLAPQQIKNLQTEASKGKGQAIEAPGANVSFMTLNLKSEPLNKLAVRQAIAALIDRQLLNQRVLQGQGEPLYSLIPTAIDAYKPVFKEVYGDGNPEKAKQLLEQAGYSPDNPAKIEIWYPSGSTTRSIVAATLKALAEKELGGVLQFQPNSVESASFFGNISKGLYQTALVDWYPDFLDADNYISPFLGCAKGSATEGCKEGGSRNQGSFYYSDRVNQLIDQQRQEQNPTARKAIFAKIQDILAQDVPYIPLWQSKDYAFAQNNIKGVIINPSQNFPFWTIQPN